MIRYKCTKCGIDMESPSTLAGEMEKCPSCGVVVRIPAEKRARPRSAYKTILEIVAKILAILLAYSVTGFLVSVVKISLLCLWNYQRLAGSLPDLMEYLMLCYPELVGEGMGYLIFAVAAGLIGWAVTRKSGITAAVIVAFISGYLSRYGGQYFQGAYSLLWGIVFGLLPAGLVAVFWVVSGWILRIELWD